MWVSHVARISEHGTHTNKHYHTYDAYKWVMSHIQISNVTHMNESCIWMSHSEHISVSDHTYECVMSHTWMRQFADTNQPCHIWMSHGTHTNGSCRTYVPCHTPEWVIPHTCMSHVTHIMHHAHTRTHTHAHTRTHTHTHTHTLKHIPPRKGQFVRSKMRKRTRKTFQRLMAVASLGLDHEVNQFGGKGARIECASLHNWYTFSKVNTQHTHSQKSTHNTHFQKSPQYTHSQNINT